MNFAPTAPKSDLIGPKASPTRAHVTSLVAAIMAQGMAGTAHATLASEEAMAAAATAPTRLDKVVVEDERASQISSPKFTAPLLDTPQTIAVIPSAVFTQQGAATVSDVLRNTPGITFAAGEGGSVASGDSFFMRGFDASGSIFIDGVRDNGAYSRDVYNLEQVEIAKGPAGADTGRGGSSGYINLATKAARLERFGQVSAQFGAASTGGDQHRFTLDVNQPLATSAVRGAAVRVNALWQDAGTPGRDFVERDAAGITGSLALGLGTPLQFHLTASYNQQDGVPDSGLPVVALAEGVRQSNFYGLPATDFDAVRNSSVTARVERELSSDLKLTNQTRYAATSRDALTTYFQNSNTTAANFAAATTPINPATGAVPASYFAWDPATGTVTPRRIRNEVENTTLSNLTNLSGRFTTGPVRHQASAGVELSQELQHTPLWHPTGGPSTDLHRPDASRLAMIAQTPYRAANRAYDDAQIDTAAFYVFDTAQLTERWLINGSFRLERYRLDYDGFAPVTAAVPSPAVTEVDHREVLQSWKLGAVFKPTAAGSLYVAYANSFIPPGSNFAVSTAATNANNPNLAPQEARNLEFGAKWEFLDSRISTSIAFYRSENLNLGSIDAASGEVTQDISQTTEGIEVGFSGRINSSWLLFGGFGLIESRHNAAGTTSSAADGARLRFTPRLSGNLWTTYALARRLTVGGGVEYSESVIRSTANGVTDTPISLGRVPSYWLVNAMVAYALNDRMTVRLNANNVLNEDSFRLNNNGGRYYPGSPRVFLLTADYRF